VEKKENAYIDGKVCANVNELNESGKIIIRTSMRDELRVLTP